MASSARSASSAAARGDPVARGVTLEQAREALHVVGLELEQAHELAVHQALVRIEQERLAAGHARAEVAPVRSEHDHRAARHVLAGVVADALDDRDGARVPHGEPLARPSRRRTARLRSPRRALCCP